MRNKEQTHLKQHRLRQFIKDRAGTAAAEFALVLAPVVAIVFGITMMGSLFFIHNDMMDAAREAARRLSVDETVAFNEGATVPCDGSLAPGSVSEIACSSLASWPVSFQVRVMSLPIPGSNSSEMRVTITTDIGSAALIDLLGAADGKTMTADVIMRSAYPTS